LTLVFDRARIGEPLASKGGRVMKDGAFVAATAAVALLAFVSPAGATHVGCGDTITQDTTLDSDIVCSNPSDVGLIVTASNVTVRLAGHTIRGSAGEFSTGIRVESLTAVPLVGVDINVGAIDGFDIGVTLDGDDSSVRKLTVATQPEGIRFTGDRNYAYRNVVQVAEGGAQAGIFMQGTDAYAWGNTVRGNAVAGIFTDGDRPRVVLNTIESCDTTSGSSIGINTHGYQTHAVVSINTIRPCPDAIGIQVTSEVDTGPDPHVIDGRFRRNVVTGNAVGLWVEDESAVVGFNTANENVDTGIQAAFPARLGFNTANDNGSYGIVAADGSIATYPNTASGNGVEDCVGIPCSSGP
jgi:hypothetical protein